MTPAEGTPPLVDLVILIDTSVSMKDEAVALSEAAEAAVEGARTRCPSDLRVTWLGLEGTWKGTRFDQKVRSYLTDGPGVSEAVLRGRKLGEVAGGGAQEDGARNIEDITDHFDWRPGAARAIFYLSDEALEGGGDRITSEQTEAADRAISKARGAGVTVHTYFGTTRSRYRADLEREFARVSQETGGQAFTKGESFGGFQQVLEKIICASRVRPEPVSPGGGFAPATHGDPR